MPNSQLSHGGEQPENPINNLENVLIECDFINLPINWVSAAAGPAAEQGLLSVTAAIRSAEL